MRRVLLIALVALAGALPLRAQEEDAEPSFDPIFATVSKDANLHKTAGGAKSGVVTNGTRVRVVGTHEGWFRVRTSDKTGWIDRRFLTPEEAEVSLMPRAFVLMAKAAKPPCKTTLNACPPNGCADPGDDHALFNEIKHGPGSGSVAKLTLASFATLQKKAGPLVGEGADLDAADRKTISKLKVGSVTTGEGHLARVMGFIVETPHPNTGESVNCGLTEPENNDVHINLAPSASDSGFESIVIETIPQNRNPGWTVTKLIDIRNKKRPILVTGQLFYDNAHRVRTSNAPGLSRQPKRFSLWEVHPITEFLVCPKASCDPKVTSQWTKLEDLPEPE